MQKALPRCCLVAGLAAASVAITWWLLAVPTTGAVTKKPDLINTAPPTISGTAQVGNTLTAGPGTWSGTAPITYTYQWSDGATGNTDTLSAADVGKNATVTVTATDSTGSATASATAGPVAAAVGAPSNTSPPAISGTAQQGDTLTAAPGSWSGTAPITYTYQWSNGATGNKDALSAADVGNNVSVTVTATNSAGSATATSPSVGPVAAAPTPPSNTSLPTISGTAQEGNTLTADPGSWSGATPITFTYQWSDGRTGRRDTLSAADVGDKVSVMVTATNSVGSATATSRSLGPVAAPPPVRIGTTTSLEASPNTAVTNETVTLIATVTSSTSATPPSGTITFKNGGTAIRGCANLPVAPSGQSVTVTCPRSFASSTPQFTAAFAPKGGSNLTASASPTDTVAIGRDSTSTSLDVSRTVRPSASTTYTAAVAPPPSRPGPIEPTGSVAFYDGGQPIASCLSQPLTNGGATCTLTYRASGAHSITAQYVGDANFTASAAAAQPVSVVADPKATVGSVTSTMQWTFYYTPTYTKVLALVVNGASGATVLVKCQGRGCPFAKRTGAVTRSRRCGRGGKSRCTASGTIDLGAGFRKRRLDPGARITVMITRPGWIGKYYLFTVRARQAPGIRIACLAPGGTRPGVGC